MVSAKMSVIVPTLNESILLEDMLKQFSDVIKVKHRLEVIVSDGNSTDNTVSIAEILADKVVIHNKESKQNIAEGRNCGAAAACGDVLVFFNADTKVQDPDRFLTAVNSILTGQDVSAIAFPIRVFKELEKTQDKMFHGFYNFYVSVLNRIGLGMGRGECHAVKKTDFLKSGGYNEKLFAGEDFDLYRRLKKIGKIHYAKEFVIRESPRRYRKFGYLNVVWDWLKNSIWIMLFNKSVSKIWEPVR